MKLNPQMAARLNKLKGQSDWNDFMEKLLTALEKEDAQFQIKTKSFFLHQKIR